ncbi:hypothetical protein Pcinc_030542 [Petrolisthes cinctipes]|uniref:BAG domain-containing protein n=1 Tax=Petrolisthes cinctipes TaxID=88211 RepID=A0AAE1EXX7_PETCI|nr:hypothetical protein Pcinc_030542 [Petrolisthes cinctipes]
MSFHNSSNSNKNNTGGGLRGCSSNNSRTFSGGDSEDEYCGDPRSFFNNRLRRDNFADRHFSPSVRKSGEEILKDLKHQLRRDGDMFFNNSPPDWGFGGPQASMFSKADEGEDGRRGIFRVPGWGGDDSVSQLAARMSQTPPLASMGRRGGPWRERRGSGGSAMSATSEDSCDAPDRGSQGSAGSDTLGHEIPIRLEAPAPPKPQQVQPQEPQEGDDAVGPLGGQGRCPIRTTSAVDASDHSNDTARNSRCASAPPEVAQAPDAPAVFVSKISITPQQPQGNQGSPVPQGSSSPPGVSQGSSSPLPAKFNTVPRPFVAAGKQQPDAQPQQQPQPQPQQQPQPQPQQQWQQQHPQQDSQWQFQEQPFSPFQQQQQHYPQQQQYQQQPHPQQQYPSEPSQRGQRPSVVRNIPIFVEGRDDPSEDPRSPPQRPPRQSQHHFQQPQPQQFQQPQPQQFQQQPPQQFHQPQPTQQQFHQPQPTQQQFHQQQPTQQQFHQPQPAQQQFHQPQQPQFQPQQKPHVIRTQQPTAPPTQPIPQPVPMPMPQPHEPSPAQPPQEEAPEQQQQQQQPPQQNDVDPRLIQIAAVAGSVANYSDLVGKFSGGRKSKEFLYLDEMLTRALLLLDNVDPDGRQDVRQARRTVIKEINASIAALEAKAVEGDKLEKKLEQPAAELMETQANEQPVKKTESTETVAPQSKTEPDTTVTPEEVNTESQQVQQSGDSDSQKQEQTAGTAAETLPAGQTQPSTDKSS